MTEEKNEGPKGGGLFVNNPFKILIAAIEKVPFVKYALGIAGITAAIAIIKSFGIENYSTVPIISILVMLGFMVLLFLFSTLTRAKDSLLKLAGYILVFTTVAITCFSSILLTASVFFEWPKPITDYGIFPKDQIDTIKAKPSNDAINEKQNKHEKPLHVESKPGEKMDSIYTKNQPQIKTKPNIPILKKPSFPFASQADFSSRQSLHDASYFAQFEIRPVENIFWKAKITREFNDEFDCVYAASHDISLRLNLLNGNDIASAKNLKVGMSIFLWGTTKEKSKSIFYLDINVDSIKIIQ